VLHGPAPVDEAAGLPPGLPGERCVRAALCWLAEVWHARRVRGESEISRSSQPLHAFWQ